MLFQTAGIEVAPWIPPVIAFVISFLTSMGGVSGAFLLLPFQMSFLGYTNPSVSATNQLFNIVAIPSGVYRYWREGRMVWPLTWVVIAGTLPGVFIGAVVRVAYLPDPKNFKLFAAVVLLYIGLRMGRDLLKKNPGSAGKADTERRFQEMVRRHRLKAPGPEKSDNAPLPAVKVTPFNLKRLGYTFYDESFDVSFWGISDAQLHRRHCRRDLRYRRRGHHRPVFRDLFRVAGLYRGRSIPDGNVRHVGGRSCFLSGHCPAVSGHVRCARLAFGSFIRRGGNGGDVPRCALSEICPGQDD